MPVAGTRLAETAALAETPQEDVENSSMLACTRQNSQYRVTKHSTYTERGPKGGERRRGGGRAEGEREARGGHEHGGETGQTATTQKHTERKVKENNKVKKWKVHLCITVVLPLQKLIAQ